MYGRLLSWEFAKMFVAFTTNRTIELSTKIPYQNYQQKIAMNHLITFDDCNYEKKKKCCMKYRAQDEEATMTWRHFMQVY